MKKHEERQVRTERRKWRPGRKINEDEWVVDNDSQNL